MVINKAITKNNVLSSIFWKFIERGGTQGVSFILSIILARLLLPREYGLIALLMIFIALANVFVESGFNTALIQKKNTDDKDFSTVFFLSLFIATLLYMILFIFAGSIANFYEEIQLKVVIRVLSIILFFGAVNSIQIAVLSREMQFKKLFFSSIIAVIISGFIGIILAYNKYGVWALVWQQITNQFLLTLILWISVKWRPKFLFSLERLKELYSFGWKILATNLINTLFIDLRSLIIGKIYSASMLGYFNRGKQFPQIIINNINGSIQSVMLPTFSSEQDNRLRVKQMVKRSITTSSLIVFPLMMGLAIIAEPLIKIILTDKWLPCVPFLQIFCATYMLFPIHTANLQSIKALGYSGTTLKIEIIKKFFELTVLIISLNYGIYAIALGTFLTSLISLFINLFPNRKLLNYGITEQLKDISPPLFVSIFTSSIIYLIKFIGLSTLNTLLIQVAFGVVLYFSLAYIFKLECLTYLLKIILNFFETKYLRKKI